MIVTPVEHASIQKRKYTKQKETNHVRRKIVVDVLAKILCMAYSSKYSSIGLCPGEKLDQWGCWMQVGRICACTEVTTFVFFRRVLPCEHKHTHQHYFSTTLSSASKRRKKDSMCRHSLSTSSIDWRILCALSKHTMNYHVGSILKNRYAASSNASQRSPSTDRVCGPQGVNLRSLECPICFDLLWKPLVCRECETPFCGACWQRWNYSSPHRCPMRCEESALRACLGFILHELARVQISCIYRPVNSSEVRTNRARRK